MRSNRLHLARDGVSDDLMRRVARRGPLAGRGVAYILGAYGYGSDARVPDRGMFILTLRPDSDGRWLITADLDGAIRP